MSNLSIQVCIFKRKENSAWEKGLMINTDYLCLDMNGNFVKAPIHSWRLQPLDGALRLKDD